LKAAFLAITLIALAATCPAQSNKTVKPDLNGTWEVDVAKSGRPKSQEVPQKIKITLNDPELVIHRQVTLNGSPADLDFVYYTDGRGETNAVAEQVREEEPFSESWQSKETESKTLWNKGKLTTRAISTSVARGAAVYQSVIIHEWRLSSDGKTLTENIKTARNADPDGKAASDFGGFEYKNVYKLISK